MNLQSLFFFISSSIDILLAAIIIYLLATRIRHPFAAAIFPLIGFLLILSEIFQILHLQVLSWFINQIFVFIPFIIIILLQQEILQFLRRLSQTMYSFKFFQQKQKPLDHNFYSDLEKTILYLSENKIGAIFVIQKEQDLQFFHNSGVSIQGVFSPLLAESIFHKQSPLHDGAMILSREGKIVAVNVFLPITATYLSSALGSRHRASLGITEIYDCVSIAISEDSGSIALANQGKLYASIPKNQIRYILDRVLTDKEFYYETLVS